MASLFNNLTRRARGRTNSSSTGTSDGQAQAQSQSQSSTVPLPANPSPPARSAAASHPSTQTSSQRPGNRGMVIHGGEYARTCRALMELLRDLRHLGADSVFDLPKIVVIGSQSAGKSSLIEAVTGITVPRDSGTCTRCPMECAMSSIAMSWTCSISLRSSATGGFSDVRRFGPDITDKSQVELWLRRAQGAILSTNQDKAPWLTKSADEIKRAIDAGIDIRKFTEDTIVVEIRDQGLTDLSFVDLPGLVQNEDAQSIGLIKDLSVQHIQGENTLILVTMPVPDDIQNQGAVVIAKDADPAGKRTIGVLTKPDLLGEGDLGSHEMNRQIMENNAGNRNYLQHGYYCVRLPDDQRRQQGYTAHNLPNPEYFDVTKPWSEVTHRGRFGVNNLVQDISAHLAELIETNLPHLRDAVEAELNACIERLAQFPPPPQGEGLTRITLLLNEFLRQLGSASVGESHKTLAQQCKSRYLQLREEILVTCPEFRKRNAGDGDDVYDIATVRQLIEDCTGWELPGFISYEVYETLIQEFLDGWKEPMESCFKDICTQFSSFIDDLTDSHFAEYRNLKSFVLDHARTELDKRKIEMETAARKLLDVETKPFFSQRSNFTQEQDKWMRAYVRVFYPEHYRSKDGGIYYTGEDFYRYRDELHVMATVRTYFQFAYERFSDTVLLMVERELVQSLKAKLELTLFSNLMQLHRQGADERLLSEDPNRERERRELTHRQQRLTDIRSRLNAFSMS